MPSMITKCPGCGRNGIMSKKNGLCFHCNKGATPAKVTVCTPCGPKELEPPPSRPEPKLSAVPRLSKRFPIMRVVRGRPVR